MKYISSILVLAVMLVSYSANAQSETELYKQGLKYKTQINNPKMLETFQKLYKMDSNNVNYAHNLAFAHCKVGANKSSKSEQMPHYKEGKRIAKRALKLNSKSAGANYSYALSLARENEHASSETKLKNAKEIKKYCDLAISLDAKKAAGAHHIMGRWHREFASMSKLKKSMAKTLYGGIPEGGTYANAVEHFQKAIKLEPWYMLHMYELAQTYHMMGKDDLAKKYVEKAMTLPKSYEDAKLTYKKCETLKKKLK